MDRRLGIQLYIYFEEDQYGIFQVRGFRVVMNSNFDIDIQLGKKDNMKVKSRVPSGTQFVLYRG